MMRALLPALALALVAGVPVAGAAGAEFAILDAYLAPHDDPSIGGDHCARRGGHLAYLAGESPDPPKVGPLAPTNALLAHHFVWHRERTFVLAGISPDDADPYGTEFVSYHRAMIADYDAWREAQGHAPTPIWDPATAIPSTFAYDGGSPLPHDDAQRLRQITGDGCIQRETEDPRVARPTWTTIEGGDLADPMFGYTELCEFPDLNRLGKSVDWDFIGRTQTDGYHSSVHSQVGGDLAPVATAPRDPVFWAWHKFLDVAIFALWEAECAPLPEPVGESPAAARAETPLPLWGTLGGLVLARVLRKKR